MRPGLSLCRRLCSCILLMACLGKPPPIAAADITWADIDPADTQTVLASGMEIALFALSLSGVDYKYGGTSPLTGMDCSGFVGYVFREAFGIALPRTAAEIEQAGVPVEISELMPGDLVFYNTLGPSFSHVGIYLGESKFIHAPRAGSRIRLENMQLPYWNTRFQGARRLGAG